ncbi:MmgE/PrpD family protein [Ureibacillus aquaedulcis]|uniref:MmgE/PrpD family protein n=1 Tax=Ureibacillus aquaedulcis TaxID=3058421 RepID=A0ABT8GKP2_9BACL|nr:MmgE/PrpD family protein [Ureibacillus sp. BA0131]MDN4491991.1 MmgE/PrpD family protein [Ureibacillus sp. BA0131]
MTVAEKLLGREFHFTDSLYESAKKVFLDTIGAMLMGIGEQEQQQLIENYSSINQGNYALLKSKYSFDLLSAAFLSGVTSVAVELDEGNQWSKGHPAVHVMPVLLLYAQQNPSYSGEQFLKDLIRAYEATTYFGRITSLKKELHAHGTWGVLGAATAYAIAQNTSVEELDSVLEIASTFASPTKWEAALEGSGIRNVYVGESLEGGIKAWYLMKSKFYAPKGNMKYVFSNILGYSFDDQLEENDDFYAIERNYYKQHAFCRYAHVPLETFQQLVIRHNINPDQIEKVCVRTYERAATLENKITENSLSSKFSIPFALASWYFLKQSDHQIFREKKYLDTTIRSLAEKIEVIHDPKLDENYPDIMPAIVTILLKDGTKYEHRLNNALGGPEENFDYEDIENKFIQNTTTILSKDVQQEISKFVRNLEKEKSVKEIFDIVNRQDIT